MSYYTELLLKENAAPAILITGGVPSSVALLKNIQARYPEAPVFCADGGADYCYRANVLPTYIIGDMDSVSNNARKWLLKNKVPEYVFPTEKDFSDTQLAIEALFKEQAQETIVLGALGGRMDHEMANVMLLVSYGRKGHSLIFVDDQNIMRYVGAGTHTIYRCRGYIGIVPFSDQGMRLSIEGLYYPLPKTSVPFGASHLISNVFGDEKEARFLIEEGDGILVRSKDKKE